MHNISFQNISDISSPYFLIPNFKWKKKFLQHILGPTVRLCIVNVLMIIINLVAPVQN